MAKILLLTLALGFLISVSPITNHMTMQAMQMDEVAMAQHDSVAGGKSGADDSTMPCCGEMAQTFAGCAFLVPDNGNVVLSRGSDRIGFSASIIQTIYIEILAPPPKT